jgi:hypothetical protein
MPNYSTAEEDQREMEEIVQKSSHRAAAAKAGTEATGIGSL